MYRPHWNYSISYHKDGDHIELYVQDHLTAFVDLLLALHWPHHIPGYYRLWSKGLRWVESRCKTVYQIPVTREQLVHIDPDPWWVDDE